MWWSINSLALSERPLICNQPVLGVWTVVCCLALLSIRDGSKHVLKKTECSCIFWYLVIALNAHSRPNTTDQSQFKEELQRSISMLCCLVSLPGCPVPLLVCLFSARFYLYIFVRNVVLFVYIGKEQLFSGSELKHGFCFPSSMLLFSPSLSFLDFFFPSAVFFSLPILLPPAEFPLWLSWDVFLD